MHFLIVVVLDQMIFPVPVLLFINSPQLFHQYCLSLCVMYK